MATTDPVCRRELDEADAVATVEHDGVTYHFEKESCARAFEQHPEDYLRDDYRPQEIGSSGSHEGEEDVRHDSRTDRARGFG